MTALDAKKQVQALICTPQDGENGPTTRAAFEALFTMPDDAEWPPVAPMGVISVPGWNFVVRIDGDDLCVDNCRATCFGGSNDPQDNGDTASGISTKKNPGLAAVSLPMDFGNSVPNTKGSPIPKLPWKTMVEVIDLNSSGNTVPSHQFPLIDIGPAKKTGNAIDFTIAAARLFNPKATASNFEMRCSFRIIGGAKFLPQRV